MQFYETFDNAQWRKVNKCNQFDNASSRAGHLRNKCKQCYFISNQAGDLRRHLKTRSGEKSNKSNQCDYMSSCAYNLRTHLKTHSGEVKQMKPMWICLQADATNLRTHLKTHSGEKLHKCFFLLDRWAWGLTHCLAHEIMAKYSIDETACMFTISGIAWRLEKFVLHSYG